MEAKKSYNLPSTSERLGKAGGVIKSESKVWEPRVLSTISASASGQAGRTKFCLLFLCSTQPLDQLYDAHPHEEGKLLHWVH